MVSTHCSISLPGFARLYATPQAQKTKSSALLLSALVLCPFAHADNVVVGNGTPASCTEAALNAAMFQLVVGVQGPGGVLTFSCGAAPHTIALTSTKFLEGQCTIDGGGLITLNGQGNTRPLYISVTNPEDQTAVELRNITLANGHGDFGGAVYLGENASLSVLRATIRNSSADFTGGGIAAAGNSLLNVANSTFQDNFAVSGGAIVSYSVANISDSSFEFNTANDATGATSAVGGAVASFFGNLNVSRSFFGGNAADFGGAVYKENAELNLLGSRFFDNSASSGGAVYLESLSSPGEIENSRFEENTASFFGGAISAINAIEVYGSLFQENQAEFGGAINLSPQLDSEIANSAFIANHAGFSGGAIDAAGSGGGPLPPRLDLFQVTTNGNSADAFGGDLYLLGANPINASISYSTLVNASSATGSTVSIGSGSSLGVAASMIWASNGAACSVESGGQLFTFDYNLAPASCGLGAMHDLFVSGFSQLGLAPLANNGGRFPTFLPQPNSPATDRVSACVFKGGDTRGRPRPVDMDGNGSADCDTGAVERQLIELVDDRIFADAFDVP
jgi:predicted outer membrane repeat protein